MKATLRLLVVTFLIAGSQGALAQTVHHVRWDASGSNDGSSWTNAFTSLQDALAAAAGGDQIWVAAGVYRPDHGAGLTAGDRSLSFELKSGVRVHGGFAGTETSRGGRDLATNRTVLSGDLLGDDDGLVLRDDNGYHVVRAIDADENSLLDGFTIVGGTADGVDADSLGGGILISGGGPWIVNTRVNSNLAGCGGGLAVINSSTATLVNVVVNGNRAEKGGGVCNLDSSPSIINATVTGNIARMGPGLYNAAASPSIANSIVAGNPDGDFVRPCEIWQFPCSTADVAEAVLQRDDAVRQGATDALLSGDMQTATDYVRNHPDVVLVLSDSLAVAWRVRGGALTAVVDATEHTIDSGTLGKRSIEGARRIVGKDWNSDGKINNRDGKRALILSPFGFEDAIYANQLLSEAPGYTGGNTIAVGPFDLQADTSLVAWSIWDQFDFVYLSTFDVSFCNLQGWSSCLHVIAASGGGGPLLTPIGVMSADFAFTEDNGDVIVVNDMSLITVVFLGHQYRLAGTFLRNAYVHCSSCTTLGAFDELYLGVLVEGIDAAVGLSFWQRTRRVLMDYDLLSANAILLQDLVQGAPASKQRASNPNYELGWIETDPVGDLRDPSLRIIELPLLMLELPTAGSGSGDAIGPLTDLTDISHMIIGTIDDEEPDQMIVREFVYGVASQEDEINFRLNFAVGTTEIPTTYDLSTALPAGGSEFVRDFREIIDLGFPVKSGLLPIEASVDLGNGTTSSYVVLPSVNAFSCSGTGAFDGYRNGAFTGAARWNGDTTFTFVNIEIESATAILAKGPEPGLGLTVSDYNITMIMTEPPDTVLSEAGLEAVFEDALVALTRRHTVNGWATGYTGRNCPECYARVIVTVDDSTDVLVGRYEFLANDATATSQDPRLTSASGTFRAVTGSLVSESTPYWQCVNQYWTAYEVATGTQ